MDNFWTFVNGKHPALCPRAGIAISSCTPSLPCGYTGLRFLEVGCSATCEHGALFSGQSYPFNPLSVLSKDIKRLTFNTAKQLNNQVSFN
jgi:hypothetical protein